VDVPKLAKPGVVAMIEVNFERAWRLTARFSSLRCT